MKPLRELLQIRRISIYKVVIFALFAREMEKEDRDMDIIVISKDFRNKSIFERGEFTIGIGRELIKKAKSYLMFCTTLIESERVVL